MNEIVVVVVGDGEFVESGKTLVVYDIFALTFSGKLRETRRKNVDEMWKSPKRPRKREKQANNEVLGHSGREMWKIFQGKNLLKKGGEVRQEGFSSPFFTQAGKKSVNRKKVSIFLRKQGTGGKKRSFSTRFSTVPDNVAGVVENPVETVDKQEGKPLQKRILTKNRGRRPPGSNTKVESKVEGEADSKSKAKERNRHNGAAAYCPVISFFISEISSAKRLSILSFLSMLSMEDMIVAWSRLKIFPMLGKDISVTERIR